MNIDILVTIAEILLRQIENDFGYDNNVLRAFRLVFSDFQYCSLCNIEWNSTKCDEKIKIKYWSKKLQLKIF